MSGAQSDRRAEVSRSADCGTDRSRRIGTLLTVKVIPRAANPDVDGFESGNVLRIRVSAAPERGKANKEMIKLLARALGVGTGRIQIRRGETARHKHVYIEGLEEGDILKRLGGTKDGT